MCIAVYVPADVDVSDSILENCFDNNPDGAGIMYSDGYKVIIEKGFMKKTEFITAFRKIPKEMERSFHCRIATSGKIEEGCCHPFPIIQDMKDMKKTKHVCDGAVAHNGVISWAAPTKGRSEWYSDSMNFISQNIYPLKSMIHDPALHELIARSTSSSKFIIMTPDKVHLIGEFTQEGGVFYSNTSFRARSANYYYGCGTNEDTGRRTYTGTKYSRKSNAISNAKDALTTAVWILIEPDVRPVCMSSTVAAVANSATFGGIHVIEEEEVEYKGKPAILLLVDKLPTGTHIYGYEWKLLSLLKENVNE